MSLDLLMGYPGLVSFGPAAFSGLGASATATLLERGVLPLWAGLGGVAERDEPRVAHEEVEAHRDRAEEERVEGEEQVVRRDPGQGRQRCQRAERGERAPGDDPTQGRPPGRRSRAGGRSGPRS